MKKIVSMIMMVLLISPVAIQAKEIDQESTNKTEDTKVTTSVDSTYLVVIPEDCKITKGTLNTTMELAVEGNPTPDASIQVDVAATELCNQGNKEYKIPYQLTSEGKEFNKITYSESEIRTGTKTPLSIDITKEAWDNAFAGDYSATLTFAIQYLEANGGN